MTLISVQTEFLRMTWVGVPDAPRDPGDPHDLDGPGIHLRWSFPTRWVAGLPLPLGWPEAGFTLYRRAAVRPTADVSLDIASEPRIEMDATVQLAEGIWLEFDPDLLSRTLRAVPAAASDIHLLLDVYPTYVTMRFADAVRSAVLTVRRRIQLGPGRRLVVVRAHDRDDVVDEAKLLDVPPAGGSVTVTADHITSLRFRLDGTELFGVTATLADQEVVLEEWDQIASLPPLRAWAAVRERIPSARRPTYEAGWDDLSAELARLFDPADDRGRWLRTFTDAGALIERPPTADEPMPSWSYALQERLLLFSLDPYVARLLGLLHADTSAEAAGGDAFDYLVVASFEVPSAEAARRTVPLGMPAGGAARDTVPFARVDWDGPVIDPIPVTPVPDSTVGWVCYGCAAATPRRLVPPGPVTARASPQPTFLPDPQSGVLTRRARIGVRWELQPEASGGPLDLGPVRFEVESTRADRTEWTSLTPDAKVVVSVPTDDVGTVTEPADFFHDTRGAGAWAYRVRGIDVFGRRSAPTAPTVVRITDDVGPPPPVEVWTRWLDPADPFLAADEQDLGEGLLVRFAYPRRPSLAGADAAMFVIHAITGARDRALDWHAATTWGTPVGTVPHTAPHTAEATAVGDAVTDDPAVRSAVVTTDLDAAVTRATGDDGGTRWSLRGGHLLLGDREYRVAGIAVAGATTTFTLAWPSTLGLPEPAAGPCTWYPGYQALLSAFHPSPPPGGSITGAVGVGTIDTAGNAGRVSAEAAFQRVDRAPPGPAAAITLGVGELLATPPDAYGRSSFRLTWEAGTDGSAHHVHRALDTVVAGLHGLDPRTVATFDAAALVELADDPVAEPAFSQLTAQPVTGGEWTDATLEGFGSNRYLYRLCPVTPAGVRGLLGPSSPPVAVPDVVAPRCPAAVKLLGGDDVVTVRFAAVAEPDVDHYVVYRTTSDDLAADTRSMRRVGEVAHVPGAVNVAFTDAGPPVGVDLHYRVTAVDTAGNESRPSRSAMARCYSTALPVAPTPTARRLRADDRCVVQWPPAEPGVAVLVQRRVGEHETWQPVSTWLHGDRSALDTGLDPTVAVTYRLLARSPWCTVAESDPVRVEGRP